MTVRHTYLASCNGCGTGVHLDDVASAREARSNLATLGWMASGARAVDGSFEILPPGTVGHPRRPVYDICPACRGSWIPPYLPPSPPRARRTP